MKTQFFKNTQVLFFALSLMPAFAFAGGGSVGVGGGGTGVLCFSIPIAQAFNGKTLTAEGLKSMCEAHTLEGYFAIHSGAMSAETLRIFQNGTAAEMRHYLLSKLAMAPAFLDAVLEEHQKLGKIEDGVSSDAGGIHDSRDSGLVMGLGDRCIQVQAAYRQADMLFYDPNIWLALGRQGHGAQQALLQLHEEIYAIAVSLGDTNSINARGLIVSLLTGDMTPEKLVRKLQDYSFGSDYQTAEEALDEFESLREMYEGFISSLQRYIDSTRLLGKMIEADIYDKVKNKSIPTSPKFYHNRRKSHVLAAVTLDEQINKEWQIENPTETPEETTQELERILETIKLSLRRLNSSEQLIY
jgi:hypothetical protein